MQKSMSGRIIEALGDEPQMGGSGGQPPTQMPDSQSGGSSIAADFAQEVNEDIRLTLDNMLINLVSRALGREISTDVDEDVVNQYRTILQNHLDGIGADLEQAFGGGGI